MAEKTVRTRYAPSPTGFMHVGNLRTALYEYLVAKSQNGKFVLRIEDTDRERLVEGAVDVIYDTMKLAGLKHDEGPDIGGDFGPYVQSERKDMYLPYAEQLIKEGKAYRCFCTKERLEKLQDSVGGGYDRHCRNLPQEEIDRLLAEGTPYVIRQKMPIEGSTTFTDAVFGEITVDNSELQDQILILKSQIITSPSISQFIICSPILLKSRSVMNKSTDNQYRILTLPCIHFRQTLLSEPSNIFLIHNAIITSRLRILP